MSRHDALLDDFRAAVDPEVRSDAIRQLALADHLTYSPAVVRVLVEALDDEDPVVKEWATVALRKLRGDRDAERALRATCEDESERESVRCCALVGLGRLGCHLPGDRLRQLYRERRERSDDLILEFAIRWAGQAATDPATLQALLDIEREEARRLPPDEPFRVVVGAAVKRCARSCLAAETITLDWLKERASPDLIDRLGEGRIRRMIEAERARRAQRVLGPDFEHGDPDEPLVPGRALADVQDEQYAQDLAEFRRVQIVERRSYIRDQQLAREAKQEAGYACQVCGTRLGTEAASRRFVHAHHIEPLSENGADVKSNLVVLCPNCHSKTHAGVIRFERIDAVIHAVPTGEGPRPLMPRPGIQTSADDPYATTCEQVLSLVGQLPVERRQRLLAELHRRFPSS